LPAVSEEKTSVHSVADLLTARGRQHSAYLIVIGTKSAAGMGRMFKLDTPEVILGRSTEAQFQVDDDGISRKHAKVFQDATGVYQLMDLGSTNGTFLNGERVKVAELKDGDKIQIGSNTVLKFSLQDELEEQFQKSIYESATRDGLTRVYNKKYFLDTLRKEFAYCLRHRVPLSLLMVDVDHFKKINDTYGHQAGDYVLARIAQRVADTIRVEDLFARYGGEEFALMLRESTDDQALICAERIRRAVDATEFSYGGSPIKVTISVGVATLTDSDYVQPEDLIAAADKYLYRAKRGGRNRVDGKKISGM
jgi:diguanylate cyclase (GGDEF)-like protein